MSIMKGVVAGAGVAFFAAGLALAPAPAAAFPAGAGLGLAADLKGGAQPLVEQVQYRRRAAFRHAPPRHHHPRHARRGNRGAALAVGAALGFIGGAALASSARARPAPAYSYDPYYHQAYQPAPWCEWRRQDLYDRWGNYVGARNVKVCR